MTGTFFKRWASTAILFALALSANAGLPDGVWIHYTGCLRGAIDPCGCKIPLGGIARRLGEIEQLRKVTPGEFHVLVDAGEWRDLADPVDGAARTACLLRALRSGPFVAVNVSLRDLVLGRRLLDSLTVSDSIPFISANLRLDSVMAPLYPPYKVVNGNVSGNQFRIAFIGLTDPSFYRASNQRAGVVALDWTLVLRDLLRDVPKEEHTDAIILLTDAQPKRLDTLLAGVVGIQLVISTSPLFPLGTVNRTGYGYAVGPMPQGKWWEAVKFLPTGPDPWQLYTRELSVQSPETPVATQIVEQCKATFQRRPLKPAATPTPQVTVPTTPSNHPDTLQKSSPNTVGGGK